MLLDRRRARASAATQPPPAADRPGSRARGGGSGAPPGEAVDDAPRRARRGPPRARSTASHRARPRRDRRPSDGRQPTSASPSSARRIPTWSQLLFQYGRYLLIASSRPGTAAREPAGDLERPGAPAVELELHDQHQHADELLAGRDHEPRRVPPAVPRLRRRARRVNGRQTARRQLRRSRLGRAPQHRPLAPDRAGRATTARAIPCGPTGRWAAPGSRSISGSTTPSAAIATYLEQRAYPRDERRRASSVSTGSSTSADGSLVTSPSTSPEHKFMLPDGRQRRRERGRRRWISRSSGTCSRTPSRRPRRSASTGRSATRSPRRATRLRRTSIGARRCSCRSGRAICRSRSAAPPLLAPVRPVSRPPDHAQRGTPALFAAARRALELRGDGGTGWSMAWKINFWARLRDGDRALGCSRTCCDLVERRRRCA